MLWKSHLLAFNQLSTCNYYCRLYIHLDGSRILWQWQIHFQNEIKYVFYSLVESRNNATISFFSSFDANSNNATIVIASRNPLRILETCTHHGTGTSTGTYSSIGNVVVQIVVYKKVSKMPNTMQISKCQTGQTCDHSVNFTQHSMNPFTIQWIIWKIEVFPHYGSKQMTEFMDLFCFVFLS